MTSNLRILLIAFTLITMSAACSRPDGPSLISIEEDASLTNTSSSNDIHNEIEAYADIPDETIEETFERIQRTSSGHAAINSDKKIAQVFYSPDQSSATTNIISNPGPFEGTRILETTGRETEEFVEVILPVTPNNTSGWLIREDITIAESENLIIVDLSERKAALYVGADLIAEAPVAIGAPNTPTPALEAIIDAIWERSSSETKLPSLYGQRLFGLNKHSEALSDFDGRRPALAIHGTDEPDLIGSAVSNGCIRMHNDDMAIFAEHVTLGTRVSIIG